MNIERKAVFYLIPDGALKARDLYVCRVVEKAFTNKHKIYIYTSNHEETLTMDTQLWTFRDISFVPHAIYNDTSLSSNVELPPILIGHTAPPADFSDILINLNPNIPRFYQQFTHIIEVAPDDQQLRATAREHYKYYQKQNCNMESHKI